VTKPTFDRPGISIFGQQPSGRSPPAPHVDRLLNQAQRSRQANQAAA